MKPRWHRMELSTQLPRAVSAVPPPGRTVAGPIGQTLPQDCSCSGGISLSNDEAQAAPLLEYMGSGIFIPRLLMHRNFAGLKLQTGQRKSASIAGISFLYRLTARDVAGFSMLQLKN